MFILKTLIKYQSIKKSLFVNGLELERTYSRTRRARVLAACVERSSAIH